MTKLPEPAAVARLFEDATARPGEPDVVIYNAATAPMHGPIAELDPADQRILERAAMVTALHMLTERSVREAEYQVRGEPCSQRGLSGARPPCLRNAGSRSS